MIPEGARHRMLPHASPPGTLFGRGYLQADAQLRRMREPRSLIGASGILNLNDGLRALLRGRQTGSVGRAELADGNQNRSLKDPFETVFEHVRIGAVGRDIPALSPNLE